MSAILHHTPGPWHAEEWTCHAPTTVRAADGVVVAECATGRAIDNAIADAAFIVRACNSHDDLLAALREAVEQLERNFITVPENWLAAIAKAEGR